MKLHGPPLQQSELFAAALAKMQRAPVSLAPFGHRALMFRRRPFPFMLSRGPLWAGAPDKWQKQRSFERAARRGLRIVNAEHPEDAPALHAAGFRKILTEATLAEIDLTKPEQTLRQQMSVKWRNRLNLAQKQSPHPCVSQRSFCADRDQWLLDAETRQRKQRRYTALPHQLVLTMSQISPKAVQLFSYEAQGTPHAAMLFVVHGTRATYHIGWSGEIGRKQHAHQLLLWSAMCSLKAQGVQTLELGPLDTHNAAGLARFKLGSGAKPRKLGGSWIRLAP